MPPFRIISMRAQARVADGAFHDHYSRAYRKLTETRDEYASVAATLREAREKERADAEATMNAEARTGWELHAKMGDEAHARALDKWEAQRERWEALKRAHALRFDKRPGDLAMERLDEHRRKMEILSHLDMAAPVHEREGGREWEWKMSLRNNWMRYVAVGNVFSELYYFRDELAFADPVHVRRAVNPEDGASYSSARGRSVLASEHMAARRRRLRRRLRNLLPGELDDEDVGMLEVVGEGMANLAEARARKRITFEDLEEQIAKDSVETWAAIQKRRADDRAATETRRAAAAAAAEAREIARLAALGPHCELGHRTNQRDERGGDVDAGLRDARQHGDDGFVLLLLARGTQATAARQGKRRGRLLPRRTGGKRHARRVARDRVDVQGARRGRVPRRVATGDATEAARGGKTSGDASGCRHRRGRQLVPEARDRRGVGAKRDGV